MLVTGFPPPFIFLPYPLWFTEGNCGEAAPDPGAASLPKRYVTILPEETSGLDDLRPIPPGGHGAEGGKAGGNCQQQAS